MSANTKAKVSGNRFILRYNDRYYGWLPAKVAEGKSAAVRKLLSAGCNPGTVEKPRWAPLYNAIKGASEKHLRCLQALISHKVDVNARYKGRMPLHHAIEQESWSGYSSVIIALLAAKADPNATDRMNDIPLLMLLVGNGRLTEPKREALLFLLAPNFATDLKVAVQGTRDTPFIWQSAARIFMPLTPSLRKWIKLILPPKA